MREFKAVITLRSGKEVDLPTSKLEHEPKSKQFHPEEEEGLEEVCMIDNLVEEHCDTKMLEDLNESFGDLDEGLPEPIDFACYFASFEVEGINSPFIQ
ncbi:hypothetical protein CK203_116460 [Vitis vinifera]|uniref:Uncharacterized protein n=1 Tax=Vitis vinifera TaxID=29760 RepID=A0A438CUL8_VITVI|nr:hypothetical protein CK203_116460 [Vitis vinifera]